MIMKRLFWLSALLTLIFTACENSPAEPLSDLEGTKWRGADTFRIQTEWSEGSITGPDGTFEGETHYGWTDVDVELELQFRSGGKVYMKSVETSQEYGRESDEIIADYTYNKPDVTIRYKTEGDDYETYTELKAVVTGPKTMKIYSALEDPESRESLFIELKKL